MYTTTDHTNINVVSIQQVPHDDPEALKEAIMGGPVSVSIEADTFYFQHYSTGILDDNTKCGTSLDHAVLAVGWGVDSATGAEYYIIKNSWSADWGDQGYVKFAIQDGVGTCGVQEAPVFPYV